MPRTLLLVLALAAAVKADDADARFTARLAVQEAIRQAEDLLKRDDHQAAVAVLEKHIAHIDGNRRYLTLLRDAYAGHLALLRKAGNEKQAALIQARLSILQPAGSPPAALAKEEEAPRPPRRVVLGKIDQKQHEGDPFADSNRVQLPGTAGVISRAEDAFAGRDFAAAGRLYEEAEQAEPGSATGCKERWAYCKLARVALTINGDGIPAGEELERDVDDALKMTANPKLEAFATQLRAKMREATAAITVRHTPREGQGWALAETANFRVFHATTEEKATRAARLAEAARTALAKKWLGEIPANWTPRCDVYLHPTFVGYTRATQAPAASPGHSKFGYEGDKFVRRIDLRMDDPNIWLSTLPHETTHVVLAGQFGKHHLPRWADEGIAVLSESRERPGMHTRILPSARREGPLFRVELLMKLDDYPDAKRVPLFYAQSISLVEFLV